MVVIFETIPVLLDNKKLRSICSMHYQDSCNTPHRSIIIHIILFFMFMLPLTSIVSNVLSVNIQLVCLQNVCTTDMTPISTEHAITVARSCVGPVFGSMSQTVICQSRLQFSVCIVHERSGLRTVFRTITPFITET